MNDIQVMNACAFRIAVGVVLRVHPYLYKALLTYVVGGGRGSSSTFPLGRVEFKVDHLINLNF